MWCGGASGTQERNEKLVNAALGYFLSFYDKAHKSTTRMVRWNHGKRRVCRPNGLPRKMAVLPISGTGHPSRRAIGEALDWGQFCFPVRGQQLSTKKPDPQGARSAKRNQGPR